jgi:glycosyltransferase involved in cell wall biosynthesis
MKVVIVHDYVTQRGGAERVVLDLLRAFPDSRLVTSCYSPDTTYPGFRDHDVETLPLNSVALFRRDPRWAFPLLARAFDRHVIACADLVICSTTGWAHRVQATAPKIVYCHNPARWLYQPDDYFSMLPPPMRRAFTLATGSLRRSDARAASRAAAYLTNSSVVADRVRSTYRIDPQVVFPARGLSPDGPLEPVDGLEPGFLLTIGRARGYKNTDVVRRALTHLPGRRLVVVGLEPDEADPAAGEIGCVGVGDAQLRWLYTNARALVAVAHEDFGLTPAEAQSFGLPSVLLRGGGYLDTTVEDVTGVFVDDPTPHAVANGVRKLEQRSWDAAAIRALGDRFSPDHFTAQLIQVAHRVTGAAA